MNTEIKKDDSTLKCPACSKETPNDNFCTKCGKQLKENTVIRKYTPSGQLIIKDFEILQHVKEIKELTSSKEVNELLKEDWILLDKAPNQEIYIMGRIPSSVRQQLGLNQS